MRSRRSYRVKDVARIAGVSVRTLHHYDEIGLLVPSARSDAGYRLYDDDDLLRLQQILIGRALGLSLEQIRRSLDDPSFDRRRALLEQREELARRAEQTAAMIRAIDEALSILDGNERGEAMDMKALFDGFDPAKYEQEAKERWGHTEAYKESMRRTKRYTEDDWKRFRDEQTAMYAEAAALLRAGAAPDSTEAMDVAERFRLSIDRWFYPCSHEMHCHLAALYETDPRFAENMDRHGEGLTRFLVAAIRANAARN
ncbi:MAG TPA: MerR family transcriptional regulator [Polyangiaceae bacterium]|nr:MerR family transcriptional regulator [Polyangiaceae bacterium]